MNLSYDEDMDDLRREVKWQRRRDRELAASPDCRDPDHPGCECCMGEDDEDGKE